MDKEKRCWFCGRTEKDFENVSDVEWHQDFIDGLGDTYICMGCHWWLMVVAQENREIEENSIDYDAERKQIAEYAAGIVLKRLKNL